MPKFKDIPSFRKPNYRANVSWSYLKSHLERFKEDHNVDLQPDFQRGHVWTDQQKIDYIEFCLMGGGSGKDIYFNCKGWMGSFDGPMVLVDGQQRINAVLDFLNNKVKAFGYFYDEYTDKLNSIDQDFIFYVNNLSDYKDVLRWYLALNTGGTIHTKEEIDKVKKMLKEG